jgi:hypothetical protein
MARASQYLVINLQLCIFGPFMAIIQQNTFRYLYDLGFVRIVMLTRPRRHMAWMQCNYGILVMSDGLVGVWNLSAWQRTGADGQVSYPLGADATGLLIYTWDGNMAVQMVGAARPVMNTGDPLNGGDVNQRAAAYSTCLAYFGTFEVCGNEVIHQVSAALFPDWSGQKQVRPFTLEGDTLTLHTPPQHLASGDVTNALIWQRSSPNESDG